MSQHQPEPISAAENRARLRRARAIARRTGFNGRVEYRHVFSTSGGAQYGLGLGPIADLLIVYADAFQRDADPDDFSLEAIIAHERGHQVVCRHPRLQAVLSGSPSVVSEEILASVVGSLVTDSADDRESLLLKAMADAVQCGMKLEEAARLVWQIRNHLEILL
ncbi:MAG: hypothetical protein HY721_09670 [Planctomycetes bacterium]|nr:hypothetical protein [Planctomycetota bacterium]